MPIIIFVFLIFIFHLYQFWATGLVDTTMDEEATPSRPISPAADEAAPHLPAVTLFPVFAAGAGGSTESSSPQLRNFSFSADLAVVNEAVSSRYSRSSPVALDDEDEEDSDGEFRKKEESEINAKPSASSYQLLESSGSDSEERDMKERDKRTRKKRKRKKRSDDGGGIRKLPFHAGFRQSSGRAWAGSDKPASKDYYVDSRGDPDNLVFGSLYRLDVPRYKLYNSLQKVEGHDRTYSRSYRKGLFFVEESDVNSLDSQLKSCGRYWSAKYSALERHKDMKKVRISSLEKPIDDSTDYFIPLLDRDNSNDPSSEPAEVEESWEDEVLRKTKEYNKMTRENPNDVKLWMDFANFQDKLANLQPQKGARLQIFEKKISILEKATEINPYDEDLLLSLLKSYQQKDNVDTLISRWEKILVQHSCSIKLWREFLHVVQGDFSTFKVSELRKFYGFGIQALSAAASKKNRQNHAADLQSVDASLVELELGMVNIVVSLCRFEWQAGYQELATALFQAVMEYTLFAPSLQLSEQSKKRLFEHFWNSSGARVGEDGALGWTLWMEKEEKDRHKVSTAMPEKEEEQGGWTGWHAPSPKTEETGLDSKLVGDNDVVSGGTIENDEIYDLNEDDVALLKMLGINADPEATDEVKDADTWARWSEEELLRDQNQWMPIRTNLGVSSNDEGKDEGEEQLSRVILFEDVSEYLFSLTSAEARLSLVYQFIDFFGGNVSQSICTNSLSWTEKIQSLEFFPDFILEDLKKVHDALAKVGIDSIGISLESLLHCRNNISRVGMMKFLRNAILLFLTIFPRNFTLQHALLIAEEQSIMVADDFHSKSTPCQALAKRLLKSDRQDILLCGVYAQREASFGNIGLARKVFDMALSSLNGLQSEIQSLAPVLYLWYCEIELSNESTSMPDSSSRVVHILSCLGSGVSYNPYKCQSSSVQLLRAHQGFKERLRTVQSSWACGLIDYGSVALVCTAALFEELTTGWTSGVKVVSDALSMVLKEKRSSSCHLEYLLGYYLRMLKRHNEQAGLSNVLQSVLQGLHMYPSSPQLFQFLVELCHLYSVPNKLRLIFDEHCQKKPSVVAWIFALSFEMSRSGTQHRIHALFERALANDLLRSSVILWRCYIAYQIDVTGDLGAAKRIFFRAIHACPWSKTLWLDGFLKLNAILSAKELSDLQEVMRDKELNLRTDIYEILLQDEFMDKGQI
ncbi:hypothetical protein V2J09_011293 [Rumex salicifolius]